MLRLSVNINNDFKLCSSELIYNEDGNTVMSWPFIKQMPPAPLQKPIGVRVAVAIETAR